MLLIISKNYGFIENYAVRAEIENQILTIIANEKFLFKSIHILLLTILPYKKADLRASLAGLNTVGTTI